MIRLVVLGGSGDAYLVSALYRAFVQHHGRSDVELVVRSRLAPVVQMFPGVPFVVDDPLVIEVEANQVMHATYPNRFLEAATPYFVHPCFLLSPVRIDKLTTKPDASQADMYRMLMRLPHDAPLDVPALGLSGHLRWGGVVIITDSTSWPNTQPGFWVKLEAALRERGWNVWLNDKAIDLGTLLRRCAEAEWVIGPQCGVMSILTTGEFLCRKTLCTPNIDGNRRPEYLAAETFPYGYVTKFGNQDYDVEEFKISDDNHDEVIRAVLDGVNGRRLWPHNPAPVMTIKMPLTPGDFIDRLAVLMVKRRRTKSLELLAATQREFDRYCEAHRQARFPVEADRLFVELVAIHDECYTVLSSLVPKALAGEATDGHAEVIAANHERVRLKTEIDRLCHAPYGEVKDYYKPEVSP